MIYFERDEPFRAAWYTTPRAYPYVGADGRGVEYPVSGFWDDRDLQAVTEAAREDELMQTAHRGRPVNRAVDTWIMSSLPVPDLPPDQLLTMREILGAPATVNIWKWQKVEGLLETNDIITAADLVAVGLHQETAIEYLRIIAGLPGWESAVVRTTERGRPRKAAERIAKNDSTALQRELY
jgi:hypothetical protein